MLVPDFLCQYVPDALDGHGSAARGAQGGVAGELALARLALGGKYTYVKINPIFGL